jgi:hypothetical protein
MSEFNKSRPCNNEPIILHDCLCTKRPRYRNLRLPHLFVALAVTLFWPARHSLSAEHGWYDSPVGQTKHLDLNKISLIRDSAIGPNLHTLQFYSFGSHFLLGVSASGFSDQMVAQLESLLLPKINWMEIPGTTFSVFVNLDYVVGYSPGLGGGYILVLTTGENIVVTAKDNAANAKIKEFGFPPR